MDSGKKENPSSDGNFEEARGEVVTDEELRNVSRELLDKDWKQLARNLSLDEGEIDAVEKDHKDDTKEKHLQMLLKWKQKFGSEATKKKLEEACRKLNRNDLFPNLSGNPPKVSKKQVSVEKQIFIEEHFIELRHYLMENYQELQLPIESFLPDKYCSLNEYYIELTMKLKDKSGRKEDDFTLHIENIFTKIDGKIPKKILIESDPGYGKTTLGWKLVSDWSNGRKYIKAKFDLVFHVSLTNFTGDLNKILVNKIKEIDDVTEEEKLEIIQSRKENVLLILDDFDRLTDRLKSTLIQILKHRKPYCEMTVVVTCRTDKMYLKFNDEYVDYRSESGSKPIKSQILSLWDKRIQIKGISQENKNEFVKRYFPSRLKNFISHNKYFHLVTSEISLFRRYLLPIKSEDFYYSPMYLLFLVILLKDKRVENINSRTEFFIKIFNSLTKRALVRNKAINLEEEVDLFNHDDAKESEYRTLLLQFGQLALEKLNRYENSFTREEILSYCNGDERIFDLGFLTRITDYETHWSVVRYETWHETVLEFLAAFFVSDTLLCSSTNITRTNPVMDSLTQHKRIDRGDSFLGIFIIGLMKSRAYRVQKFFPWLFYVNNCLHIPFEIEYSDENKKFLCKIYFSLFFLFVSFLYLCVLVKKLKEAFYEYA